MPRSTVLTGLAPALFLLASGCGGDRPGIVSARASQQVAIALQGAVPAPLAEIRAGESVAWENRDSADHSVTSPAGLWDSGRIRPGGVFSIRFDEPGEYEYLSVFDPTVRGVVHVRAP